MRKKEEERREVEEWLFVLLPAPIVRAVNHRLLRIKAWKCLQGRIAPCLPFEAGARVRVAACRPAATAIANLPYFLQSEARNK